LSSGTGQYGVCRSTQCCLAVWCRWVESSTRPGGFRALKKTTEAPYTTKVNNRMCTSRGTTPVYFRLRGPTAVPVALRYVRNARACSSMPICFLCAVSSPRSHSSRYRRGTSVRHRDRRLVSVSPSNGKRHYLGARARAGVIFSPPTPSLSYLGPVSAHRGALRSRGRRSPSDTEAKWS
jgi:hypothetical protein